jgi:inner membrane protein
MASIGHVAVGMAAARSERQPASSRRKLAVSMLLWSALSLLPDADVIGFAFGIRYADPWGHRGATHSFVFALAVGVFVGLFACIRGRAPFWRTAALATLVLASHPLLDTLTDGGRGCALFWPFDDTRHFAPLRPIPVAPIGLAFLSRRGLGVAAAELLLFAPLFLYALWPRRRNASSSENPRG